MLRAISYFMYIGANRRVVIIVAKPSEKFQKALKYFLFCLSLFNNNIMVWLQPFLKSQTLIVSVPIHYFDFKLIYLIQTRLVLKIVSH